jgi:D-sedoheptulose 7-phosphate isomerase
MNYLPVARESARLLERFFSRKSEALTKAVEACVRTLRAGGKILAFGNGGSAAEAQHFAAELVNRFQKKRPALRALALTTDTSILTSVGNDSAFHSIFSRQVEALGDKGDIALALSTSGGSPNVIKGLAAGRKKGMITIGLTGRAGGEMAPFCDHLLDVPSRKTPRIQEVHLAVLHILAGEIEKAFS